MRTLQAYFHITIALCLCCVFAQTTQLDCGATEFLARQVEFDDETDSEEGTPVAAIRAFYTALAEGRGDAARRFLVSPDDMGEWVEIQIKVTSAFKRLGTEAVAQFGEEGKSLQVPAPATLVLKKLDEIKPIVDGDSARWPINPRFPLKMKKIDGRWKFDLVSSFGNAEAVKFVNRTQAQTADLIDQVATDISDGKFQSVDDVRAAVKQRRSR